MVARALRYHAPHETHASLRVVRGRVLDAGRLWRRGRASFIGTRGLSGSIETRPLCPSICQAGGVCSGLGQASGVRRDFRKARRVRGDIREARGIRGGSIR